MQSHTFSFNYRITALDCKLAESSEFEYVIITDQDCPVDTNNSKCTTTFVDKIWDSYPYVTLNIVDSWSTDDVAGEYHGGECIKCDGAVKQDEGDGNYQQSASWDSKRILWRWLL